MADDKIYQFRHKTVRRFSTAGYNFKDFKITVVGDEAREKFLEVIGRLPEREKVNIVEINVEAAAAAEKSISDSLKSSAVRGAMGAADILTAKDADAQAKAESQRISNDLSGGQQAPKPTGFNLAGLNLTKPQS